MAPSSAVEKQAEEEFLAASIAVWREIDRLEANGPYPGIPPDNDLRQIERAAWERYRAVLEADPSVRARLLAQHQPPLPEPAQPTMDLLAPERRSLSDMLEHRRQNDDG